MTPDEAADLQRQYRQKRRRWAWKLWKSGLVFAPYSGDLEEPPPAVLDGADPEDG